MAYNFPLRGTDCDTDRDFVVATVQERLSLKKGNKQNLVADRYNYNKSGRNI